MITSAGWLTYLPIGRGEQRFCESCSKRHNKQQQQPPAGHRGQSVAQDSILKHQSIDQVEGPGLALISLSSLSTVSSVGCYL